MGDGPTRLRGRGRGGSRGRYSRKTPQQIAEGVRHYRVGEWRAVWGTIGAVALAAGALFSGAGLAVAAAACVAGAVGGAAGGGLAAFAVNQFERFREAGLERSRTREAEKEHALAPVGQADAAAQSVVFSANRPGYSDGFNHTTAVAQTADAAAPAASAPASPAPRR